MAEKEKLNSLVLLDKKKLGQMLDELKTDAETEEMTPWYRCNICGDLYIETEIVDDEDVGYICNGCARSKKELDQEQEDIKTMMREEKKSNERRKEN